MSKKTVMSDNKVSMVKNTDLTTRASKKPKNTKRTNEEWDQYFSTISFQMQPANDAAIERLAIEFVLWAREKPDAYFLEEFFDIKGIYPSDVERWAKKNDCLARALVTVKGIIGRRREKGAMEKKLDSSTVHYMMPHYSQAWRDEQERRATLRNQAQEPQKQIVVVLDKFPSDTKVPAKILEE